MITHPFMPDMNRRSFLQRSSILGALALAGCTTGGDSADPGESTGTPTPTESPTATETPTFTVSNTSVETTDTSCSSGGAAADVSIGDGTVDFSGRLHAPTPCYEVVVKSTAYDAEGNELTVTLGIESTAEVCVECVGSLVFEGDVSFEGEILSEATLRYDGGILASSRDDVETTTPAEPPTLVSTSFDLGENSAEGVTEAVDARFDTETNTVVVTGTILGKNGCMTAKLGDVEYDAAADSLSVNVVTTRREGTKGDVCTQESLPLPYEARFGFEGGLPTTVEVSHDGDSLLTAGHESSSAQSSNR